MTKEEKEEFFKSLSEDDWDKAVAIETELGILLSEGLPEDVSIKFVRTVMAIRAVIPEATVEGVHDMALRAGLSYLGDKKTIARMQKEPGCAGGTVLRDGERFVKNAKRARRG